MKRLPLIVVATCLMAIAVALLIPPTDYSERSITFLFSIFASAYVLVGGLVSASRPDNRVGWLMLGIGGLMTVPVLVGAYAGYALLESDSMPGGRWGAWLTSWAYVPIFGGIILLVLIFPTGRLGGLVRTWAARVCVAGCIITSVAIALLPEPMDGFGDLPNPLGWAKLAEPLERAATLGGLTVAATFLVALGSVVARLRGARGEERQQLKWFVYAGVMMVIAELPNTPLIGLDDSLIGLLGVVIALTALPVGVAIAILRHRLYDIDVVIKRTLVYGSLSLLLVATYFVLVLLLRVLLGPLVGESDIAVAASTLAVAALFRPLRARVQEVVDRRFYRRKYDAAHTVESFTGRLRQEVDLDAVSADLGGVVRETMQPAHVSLWLREASR